MTNGADWQQQQEVLEQEALLTEEAYSKWLYENYSIWNGDRLISLLEDGCTQEKYLRDMGLPIDSEIKGI